jgi:hypothetical protein
MTTGSAPGSYAFATIGPSIGQLRMEAPGGSMKLVISGEVVDERGTHLGDLASTCKAATDAWEQILVRAGAPLSSQP